MFIIKSCNQIGHNLYFFPLIDSEKLLIYEMPWIFNAAWKIIKTWLSAEAIAKIKFVTKSDIHTYIEKRFLFPHLGGQVGEFSFLYMAMAQKWRRISVTV